MAGITIITSAAVPPDIGMVDTGIVDEAGTQSIEHIAAANGLGKCGNIGANSRALCSFSIG